MKKLLKQLDRALAHRPMPIMCYATSVAALGAAALGALINYALAEFMAVTGMLTISVFFFGLGLLHRNHVMEPSQSPVGAHDRRRPEEAYRGSNGYVPRNSIVTETHTNIQSELKTNVNEPVSS